MKRKLSYLVMTVLAIFMVYMIMKPYYIGNQHVEIRAAMDIGSGTTNMKIARVDTKKNQVISFLYEQRVPIGFQKALELSGNNTFNQDIRDEGIFAMNMLKGVADEYRAQKVVAIATSAFRTATNGPEFAKEIYDATGVDVEVISQEQEGILGYYAALSKANTTSDKTIVWDIGGGSIQLTFLEPSGDFFVERGDKASVAFKNSIIEKVQAKNIQEVHSPNPLTKDEIDKGIALAREQGEGMSQIIKDKIKSVDGHVYAIGNLFYYGIKAVVDGKDTFTVDELRDAVYKLQGVTDEDLGGGPLAEVKNTNAVFVLGLMEGLGIKSVTLVDVNNADGALIYPDYWKH